MAGARWQDAGLAVRNSPFRLQRYISNTSLYYVYAYVRVLFYYLSIRPVCNFPSFQVEKIAPKVVEADPDGVTLYFFSNTHITYPSVRTADQVRQLFAKEKPGGTTDLGM